MHNKPIKLNANTCRSTNDFSLIVSGTLLLKKAEFLSVSVFSSGDKSYRIHRQSGFSCHQLTEQHGFHAVKTEVQDVGDRWTRIIGWRAEGKRGLYSVGSDFNGHTGIFTASKNGAYYCAARIRFDRISTNEGRDIVSYIHLSLRLYGEKDGENVLRTMDGNDMSSKYQSLDLAGTVALKVGQLVSVWAYSNVATQIKSESGFSCHLMGTHKGFHAKVEKNIRYGMGWSTLKGWRTWGIKGSYGWGGRPSADGSYTAPESGFYACAAQVRSDKYIPRDN